MFVARERKDESLERDRVKVGEVQSKKRDPLSLYLFLSPPVTDSGL